MANNNAHLLDRHHFEPQNATFISRFTLRVSHMVGSDLFPANLTEDGIFELFSQELESYVIHPWAWTEADLATPFYAILVPVLALIILITNIMILIVFKKERLFSPLNILMIAIAVADTLTVLLPVPFLIYIHFSGTAPFVPEHLCRVHDYVGKYLPEITHTTSIWLTVTLSMQRYISVCKPFKAKYYCTKKTSICFIVASFVAAFLIHLGRFLDTTYVTLIIHDSKLQNGNITTCQGQHVSWLKDFTIEYECIYYWTVILLVKLIPFITIITLDILMAKKLRKSEREFKMIQQENLSQKRRKESARVTKIIIIVTAVIVVVEIPLMVTLILWTLTMIHQKLFITEDVLGKLSIAFNLMIYISFPVIFFLYCAMSHKFRRGFRRIIKCNKL